MSGTRFTPSPGHGYGSKPNSRSGWSESNADMTNSMRNRIKMSSEQHKRHTQLGAESIRRWKESPRSSLISSITKVSTLKRNEFNSSLLAETMVDPLLTKTDVEPTLFDPVAPSEMFERHRYTQRYVREAVEDEFISFAGGNRRVFSLVAIGTIMFAISVPIHHGIEFLGNLLGWLHIACVSCLMLVFAIHKRYVLGGRRLGEISKRLEQWIGARGKERRIRTARQAEVIALAFQVCLLWVPIDEALSLSDCLRREAEGRSYHYCILGMSPYVSMIQCISVLFFTIRQVYTIPYSFVVPVVWLLFRLPFTMVDTWITLGKFGILYVTTLFILALLRYSEYFHRQRFEAWVVLNRHVRRLKEEQSVIDQSLRSLLPPAALNKLMSNQPVVDASDVCSISVCQVFDFVQWSSTVLPSMLVESIDALFVTFDAGVPRFHLDKVRSIGDRYIISHGLQQRCVVLETAPIVHCALWQQSVAEQLAGMLVGACGFELQIGIATGKCFGGIMGTHSLWYEVYGEACSQAMQFAQCCPPSGVLVGEATRVRYHNAFIEEPWNVGDDIEAYVIEGVTKEFNPTHGDLQAGDNAAFEDAHGRSLSELDDARRDFLRSCIRRKLNNKDVTLEEVFASFEDRPKLEQALTQKNWWDMRFPTKLEESFDQNARLVATRFGMLAICGLSSFTAVLLSITLGEGTYRSDSAMWFALSTLLCTLRVVQNGPKFRPWLFLLREVLMYASVCAATFYLDNSIVNGRLVYMYVFLLVLGFVGSKRLPYQLSALQTASLSLICMYTAYITTQRLTVEMRLVPPTSALCSLFYYYSSERFRRRYLRDVILSRSVADSTANTYVLQRTMLTMLVPPVALQHVQNKAQAQGAALVQPLGFVSIAAVRIESLFQRQHHLPGQHHHSWGPQVTQGSSSSTALSSLRHLEENFKRIEETIATYGTQHGVAKIQALGDTVLIGGPLYGHCWEPPVDLEASTNLFPIGAWGIDSAEALLDVVFHLKQWYRGDMTAVIACGSAVSAVIGRERPTFELLGPLTRTVSALEQASPKGFTGVSNQFVQLLSDHHVVLPRARRAEDFALGESHRWRMRGAGVVTMTTLIVKERVENSGL